MHENELTEGQNPFEAPVGPIDGGQLPTDLLKSPAPMAQDIPGPGLPESVAWTFSCFVVQTIATIGAAIAYAVYVAATQGVSIEEAVQGVEKGLGVGLIAVIQATFVLYALIAVTLRVGRPWAHRLNLSPIDPIHFLLIMVMLIPLSQMSGAFYMVGSEIWSHIVDALPFLSALDQANAMEMIGELANSMSLPMMLLLVAVAPAIAEELIFRGLIGRGLVARWGICSGVLLTTLLFAAVHLHPAHAFGVIPLGIGMHLVYLTTRSFWAPVLLHFANNSMATLAAKLMDPEDMQRAIDGGETLSLPMIVAATSTVCAALFVMWKTRVQHVMSDGTIWDPGYPNVERPPIELDTRVARGPIHWGGVVWVAASIVAFMTAAAIEGAEKLAQ